MTNVIRRHSSKIQKPTATTPEKKCNCRKKDDCPLDGACLTNNLVYKAIVTAAGHGNKEYIGMTERIQNQIQQPPMFVQAQETFNENRLIKVYLGIERVEHQLHHQVVYCKKIKLVHAVVHPPPVIYV